MHSILTSLVLTCALYQSLLVVTLAVDAIARHTTLILTGRAMVAAILWGLFYYLTR